MIYKNEFVELMKSRIESIFNNENSYNLPNTEFVTYVNNYIEEYGSYFPDEGLLGLCTLSLFTAGLYPAVKIIWYKKVIGCKPMGRYIKNGLNLIYGQSLESIFDHHCEWLNIDINNEVPILYHEDKIGAKFISCFLLTNLAFYYKLQTSQKLRDYNKITMGKIECKNIDKFDVDSHIFSGLLTISINDEQRGSFNPSYFGGHFPGKLIHNLFQNVLQKKQTLITSD